MDGAATGANNNIKDAAIARIESEVEATKKSCWNCCRRNKTKLMDDVEQAATVTAQTAMQNVDMERGKCGLCLRRVFCCQQTQRVETQPTADSESQRGCCSCWPCRKKPKTSMAWAEARAESLTGEAPNK